MKGIKLMTETSQKDITFLADVDAQFVSLVKHAANQIPFRVIKADTDKATKADFGKLEKGGDKDVGMVIQSIILPRGLSLDVLTASKGMQWLADAVSDGKQEFDKYTKYVQTPLEKFEKGSLSLMKIHESGAWVVVGKMADKNNFDAALTFGKDMAQKLMDLNPSPMERPIASMDMPPMQVSFGDVFNRELSSFLNVIQGAMGQSVSDPKVRKQTIMSALEAFGGFLSMSLDAVGKEAVKFIEKEDQGQGGTEMELFKSKEEFVQEVTGIFDNLFAQRKASETEEEKKKRLEEEKKRMEEEGKKEVTELKTTVTEQTNIIKELTTKFEKLSNELGTDPAGSTEAGTGGDLPKKDEKVSPFKGMFTLKKSATK